ncbi:MAG: Hsp20 family protein [Alphaproteobacteria bacterium]
MTSFDFSPLFRSTIGFDRMANLLDSLDRLEDNGYPPYDIEVIGENAYRIIMAVAGFDEDEVEITVQENRLDIKGEANPVDENLRYLHRGIARRAFQRRFELADHIQVTGAGLENGLLFVDLVRELPEAMKPRTITISGKISGKGSRTKAITDKAA